MSTDSLACVVDANVALKLFFDQPLSDKADALFAHLATDTHARFFVPDFFYAECASAFAKYVRVAGYSTANAQQDMADLLALSLHVTPTASLAAEALKIAIEHHVSGYDAFYVALSAHFKAPLITADEKLMQALVGSYDVRSLTLFSIPPLQKPFD